MIHQFLMHAAIVAYILARYTAGEIRMNYTGIWQALGTIAVLIVPIYFIDKAFEENFVFLIGHAGNPALKLVWDLSGGKGGISYIIGLGVLVLITMHVTYAVLLGIQMIRRRFNSAA